MSSVQSPSALTADGAGNTNVNVAAGGGAGGTSSNFGANFPATGTPAGFKDSNGKMAGVVLDAQGNVPVAGNLTTSPPTSNTSTAAAQTVIGSGAVVQLLAANANRKRFTVKQSGTTVIKIVLGAGDPTQTVYHLALPAGGSADDGAIPIYTDDLWKGAVRAISSASGGTVLVCEMT